MNRYSFSSFVVNDMNRQAHDVCLAIGALEADDPCPLMIIGDSGAGKTHLLCSIVNQIQQNAPRTALGYVTARDFPAEVRALKDNPAPVTRAAHAVLLVDQLEKFSPDLLQCLADVAPLFMGDNRYLVFAARSKPEPDQLPSALRVLVESARICNVARTESKSRKVLTEALKQEVGTLEVENQALRDELEAAHQEIGRLSDVIKDLQADYLKLEEHNAALAVREQEARSLQQALEETRKQRDALQAENTELASAGHADGTEQVAALESELAEARAEAQKARKDADEAREELNRLTLRAQSILQKVELNRIRLAENEEIQHQQVLALQQRVGQLAVAGGNEAESDSSAQMLPWYVAPFTPPREAKPGDSTDIS